MRKRRAAVVLVSIAAAVSLTACSAATKAAKAASPGLASVADVMALAVKKTSAVDSFHIAMTETVPNLGTITTSGRMSRSPIRADMTMSNPTLAKALGAGTVRFLMVGTVFYMDMGSKMAAQDGGKPWFKMDLTKMGAQGKALADSMNRSSGQSPATSLRLLTASKAVRRVGTETVDGVQATHYAGTLSRQEMLAAAKSATGAQDLQTFSQDAQTMGMTSEHIDLWLNSDDVPVKVAEVITTAKGAMAITGHYSDFSSAPVSVTPPPAGQTLDFAAMLAKLKGQQG